MHHQLLDQVATPTDVSAVNVARWLEEDPRDAALRKAMAFVEEAHDLRVVQNYAGASQKCGEAIELAPNYAPAYSLRSRLNADYVATYHARLTPEQCVKQMARAEKDFARALQFNPSDLDIALDMAGNLIVAAVVLQQMDLEKWLDFCREAVKIAEKVMTIEGDDMLRGSAHSVRAAALDGLGQSDAALRDHNDAIRLVPDSPSFYWSRSEYWRSRGRPDLQKKDLDMENKLRRMYVSSGEITQPPPSSIFCCRKALRPYRRGTCGDKKCAVNPLRWQHAFRPLVAGVECPLTCMATTNFPRPAGATSNVTQRERPEIAGFGRHSRSERLRNQTMARR